MFNFILRYPKNTNSSQKEKEAHIQAKNYERFVAANYGQTLDQAVPQQWVVSKEKYYTR